MAVEFVQDEEFRCRCGRTGCSAPVAPSPMLRTHLNVARHGYGKPIVVTSGNRCPEHNRAEGGGEPSEHVQGGGCWGCDIACTSSRERWRLLDALSHAGFVRVVIYPRHLHVGIGEIYDAKRFPPNVIALGGYPSKEASP